MFQHLSSFFFLFDYGIGSWVSLFIYSLTLQEDYLYFSVSTFFLWFFDLIFFCPIVPLRAVLWIHPKQWHAPKGVKIIRATVKNALLPLIWDWIDWKAWYANAEAKLDYLILAWPRTISIVTCVLRWPMFLNCIFWRGGSLQLAFEQSRANCGVQLSVHCPFY